MNTVLLFFIFLNIFSFYKDESTLEGEYISITFSIVTSQPKSKDNLSISFVKTINGIAISQVEHQAVPNFNLSNEFVGHSHIPEAGPIRFAAQDVQILSTHV